jgi:hypothetical protein
MSPCSWGDIFTRLLSGDRMIRPRHDEKITFETDGQGRTNSLTLHFGRRHDPGGQANRRGVDTSEQAELGLPLIPSCPTGQVHCEDPGCARRIAERGSNLMSGFPTGSGSGRLEIVFERRVDNPLPGLQNFSLVSGLNRSVICRIQLGKRGQLLR